MIPFVDVMNNVGGLLTVYRLFYNTYSEVKKPNHELMLQGGPRNLTSTSTAAPNPSQSRQPEQQDGDIEVSVCVCARECVLI